MWESKEKETLLQISEKGTEGTEKTFCKKQEMGRPWIGMPLPTDKQHLCNSYMSPNALTHIPSSPHKSHARMVKLFPFYQWDNVGQTFNSLLSKKAGIQEKGEITPKTNYNYNINYRLYLEKVRGSGSE